MSGNMGVGRCSWFLAGFIVTRLFFLCDVLSFLESRDHTGSPAVPDGVCGVM